MSTIGCADAPPAPVKLKPPGDPTDDLPWWLLWMRIVLFGFSFLCFTGKKKKDKAINSKSDSMFINFFDGVWKTKLKTLNISHSSGN